MSRTAQGSTKGWSKLAKSGQPTPGDVHVSRPLTNFGVAYLQDPSSFVAGQVFPTIGVNHKNDEYWQMSRDDFWRDEARPRAAGTRSAGGGFNLSQGTYNCTVEAFHTTIDDQTRQNQDDEVQLDQAAVEFVTHKMLIRKERRFMSSYFTTGIWGTDITPSVLWSAASGSTPQKDVETGRISIMQRTGKKANTLVLGIRTFSALKTNHEIIDRMKYTTTQSITTEVLARYFEVERVIVAEAVYQAALEGATATPLFIGGNHALLCYVDPRPTLRSLTAGVTFGWSGFTGGTNGFRIKRWREEGVESDFIEGQMAYDMKAIAADCGYFFNAVVS